MLLQRCFILRNYTPSSLEHPKCQKRNECNLNTYIAKSLERAVYVRQARMSGTANEVSRPDTLNSKAHTQDVELV